MRVSGRGQRVPWAAQQNREAWGKPYAISDRLTVAAVAATTIPQADADHPTDPRRYRVVVGLRPSRASPARISRCTGHVTGRAASSLRSGTSRAMPCVVGDVHRSTPCASARITPSLPFRHDPCCGRARRSAAWLVNRRSPHPHRFAARSIPCQRPPPAYVTEPR